MRTQQLITMVVLTMLGLAGKCLASNVDLSTVPRRESVQLTIYNSEDLTLVRETRTVTFRRGVNPLQFSWANTLIDPTSVELKFPGHEAEFEVLDSTFPRDKPQMLYWNVQSDIDGEATIAISYFTSGISWTADYVCIANTSETTAGIEGFVRVTNNSGEEYKDAHIRLVVGTINLVEKIAELAHLPVEDVARLSTDQKRELFRSDAAKRMFHGELDNDREIGFASGGALQMQQKQIIKEGLSEYFIYTIDGTEMIPNGWSKRMRSFDAASVPFKIQYRYRPQEYGDRLVRMYLLTNDKDSKLGTTPLPNGTVRLFRDNGRDGLSFLASQSIKYVPIGDKIELNLGEDPNVIFNLRKLRTSRDNIWLQLRNGNVLRRADDGALHASVNSTVVGWDTHTLFDQQIRNYSARTIDVEICRGYDGHDLFRSELNPTLHDYRTVEFAASVEPAKTADLGFELVQHEGRNAKQGNVTLQTSAVTP